MHLLNDVIDNHSISEFCNAFSLKVERGVNDKFEYILIDPYGVRYTVSYHGISVVINRQDVDLKKIKKVDPETDEEYVVTPEPKIFAGETNKFIHVIRSLNEFCEYWKIKVVDTKIISHTDVDDCRHNKTEIKLTWYRH